VASKIVDLDAIVPDTFDVKLGGDTYSLPKSVPLETAIKMMKIIDRSGETEEGVGTKVETMEEMFNLLGQIFQAKYPDFTSEKLRSLLTLQQGTVLMGAMVKEVFELKADEEGKEGNP